MGRLHSHRGSYACQCTSSYRIHLTPGSRRNSASTRSQVLSGIKKHVKALPLPPPPQAPSGSPPSTPPALELAVVPGLYSASEPSPHLSYSSVQEYVKQDYQDAVPISHYFDPRGSPRRAFDAGSASAPEALLSATCPSEVMRGLRRDSCDNAPGNEHGTFPPQDRIYVPSSGALLMTGSHALNGISNSATYTMYDTYVPSNHPPTNDTPPAQANHASVRLDVSFLQPRSRADSDTQTSCTGIPSNQSHISPVTSDSPSPVSSISLSPHSSEHSPPLYQKQHFTVAVANDMTYSLRAPSQSTQLQATATAHYHPSGLVSTGEMYNRESTTVPWQNSFSHVHARGITATHGGVGFVL
ncbi:hypothetical protein F5148DRAFT_826512 [Russula earlei]|uniref:Uncharacterized protein n=1 Tax=Russula earlei TaxID=71964 RepID=A0ACC0UB25_9AGAM|nr:hypothetical protein F5148DRAFT_826512 [Russula earlei]